MITYPMPWEVDDHEEDETTEATSLPLVPYRLRNDTTRPRPKREEMGLWEAAFKRETIIGAHYASVRRREEVMDYVESPKGQAELAALPEDWYAEMLKQSGLEGDEGARRILAEANDPEEFLLKKLSIEQEREATRVLTEAGIPGFLTMMAAGALDPVTAATGFGMLKVGAGAVRGSIMLTAAKDVGVPVAATEVALQAMQEERTLTESAANVAGGVFLTSALGGAARFVRARERANIAKSIENGKWVEERGIRIGVDENTKGEWPPNEVPEGTATRAEPAKADDTQDSLADRVVSEIDRDDVADNAVHNVGAAEAETATPRLELAADLGLGAVTQWFSPVVRGVRSASNQVREMTVLLTPTGGLRFKQKVTPKEVKERIDGLFEAQDQYKTVEEFRDAVRNEVVRPENAPASKNAQVELAREMMLKASEVPSPSGNVEMMVELALADSMRLARQVDDIFEKQRASGGWKGLFTRGSESAAFREEVGRALIREEGWSDNPAVEEARKLVREQLDAWNEEGVKVGIFSPATLKERGTYFPRVPDYLAANANQGKLRAFLEAVVTEQVQTVHAETEAVREALMKFRTQRAAREQMLAYQPMAQVNDEIDEVLSTLHALRGKPRSAAERKLKKLEEERSKLFAEAKAGPDDIYGEALKVSEARAKVQEARKAQRVLEAELVSVREGAKAQSDRLKATIAERQAQRREKRPHEPIGVAKQELKALNTETKARVKELQAQLKKSTDDAKALLDGAKNVRSAYLKRMRESGVSSKRYEGRKGAEKLLKDAEKSRAAMSKRIDAYRKKQEERGALFDEVDPKTGKLPDTKALPRTTAPKGEDPFAEVQFPELFEDTIEDVIGRRVDDLEAIYTGTKYSGAAGRAGLMRSYGADQMRTHARERTLKIDAAREYDIGNGETAKLEDFLVKDVGLVLPRYAETVMADVALARVFGDVDPVSRISGSAAPRPAERGVSEEAAATGRPDASRGVRITKNEDGSETHEAVSFAEVVEKMTSGEDVDPNVRYLVEYDAPYREVPEQIGAEYRKLIAEADKAGNKREVKRLQKDRDRQMRNLRVIQERIRGQRLLSAEDPSNKLPRLLRGMMNVNVIRMMGMLPISSLPDLARPMMRHGARVHGRALWHMVTNMPKVNELRRTEGMYVGAGVDYASALVMEQMVGLAARHGSMTAVETGLGKAAAGFGKYSLANAWNTMVGSINLSVANAIIAERVAIVTGYMPGSLDDVAKASRELSRLGITRKDAELLQRKLIEQDTKYGDSNTYRGALMPNSASWKEGWDDLEGEWAQRVWRQAVRTAVDDMMLRPTAGVLPAFSDESSIARAMFQFRSFQASAAVKGLMVAAQDARAGQLAPVFLAIGASLGLGALSVYLSSQLRGGDAIEKMENASIGWWIDHAIERSGLLGWFGLITEDIASMLPGTVGAAVRFDQSHLDPRAGGLASRAPWGHRQRLPSSL